MMRFVLCLLASSSAFAADPPQGPLELDLPDGVVRRTWPDVPPAAKTGDPTDLRCQLQVTMDGEGYATQVTVVDCPDVLKKSMTSAVSGWRFRPAVFDGDAVAATFPLSVHYMAASEAPPSMPSTKAIETLWVEVPRCQVTASMRPDGALEDIHGSWLPECGFEATASTFPEKRAKAKEPAVCRVRFVAEGGKVGAIERVLCDDDDVFAATRKNVESWRWPWWERGATPYDITLEYRPEGWEAPDVSKSSARTKVRVPVHFPEEAIDAGIYEADCNARVRVGPDGRVTEVDFPSCSELFQPSARDALLQWEFELEPPATTATMLLSLRYRLAGPPTAAGGPSTGSGGPPLFEPLETEAKHCVVQARVTADGTMTRLAASRIPECVPRPLGGLDWPKVDEPDRVLTCSTIVHPSTTGVGVEWVDCPSDLRAAAKRTLKRWQWPEPPEDAAAPFFEVTLEYAPGSAP